MHSLFFLLFFTLISSVYCQSNIPFETIILTNGKYRYKTDQTLVNGKVEQNIGEEYPRNYRILFSVEGGLLEGSYSYYYGNGQLSQVEFYKKGKRVGPRKRWWMNDNKMQEWTSHKTTFWYKSGQMREQSIFGKFGNLQSRKCWNRMGEPIDCD